MSSEPDWIRLKEEGLFETLGPIFHLPVTAEVGRFRFHSEPRHRNRSHFVHGGMLMAFADRALGETARQKEATRRYVTVQLDMHFIRPAPIGKVIEMECRLVRHARSILFLEGEITTGEVVVATARGVWKDVGVSRNLAAEPPPA
jgi:uncharacterized protein (TIGR00369 family)